MNLDFNTKLKTWKHYIQIGKQEVVLNQVQQYIENTSSYLERLELQYLMVECNLNLRNTEKAASLLQQMETEHASYQTNIHKYKLYLLKARMYSQLEQLDKALEFIIDGETIFNTMDDELKNKYLEEQSYYLNEKGNIFWKQGNAEMAEKYFFEGFSLREKLGNNKLKADSLNNIGIIHMNRGALLQALEYYERSMKIYEEIGLTLNLAIVQNNIGYLKRIQGNLDEAETILTKSKMNYALIGDFRSIGFSLYNLGGLYLDKNEFKKSMIHFTDALEYWQQAHNLTEQSRTLFQLIRLSLAMKNEEMKEQYWKELSEINEIVKGNSISNIIQLRTKFAMAIIQKNLGRLANIIKAEEIFNEILIDPYLDFELSLFSMKEMGELLLLELKIQENVIEVYEKAKNIISQLKIIGQKQFAFSIVVIALILQAKFAILEGKINQATNLLEQARIMAEEKGLKKHETQVIEEQKILLKEIQKWENYSSSNTELSTKIKQAELLEYLGTVQNIINSS
ncbi:MAG: tetratricopeptide repeat protein [Candidatus Heimdallarchaeota archaeon]|nr:tetratricopeptide repeat protein [Candidatus Heimdallarchaeota archaeon]